jgi:hypothetical protein
MEIRKIVKKNNQAVTLGKRRAKGSDSDIPSLFAVIRNTYFVPDSIEEFSDWEKLVADGTIPPISDIPGYQKDTEQENRIFNILHERKKKLRAMFIESEVKCFPLVDKIV